MPGPFSSWRLIAGLGLLLCLLITPACAPSGTPPAAATPTTTNEPGNNLPPPLPQTLQRVLQTEQLLAATPHPKRDLYNLAQRLKLHSSQPPSPVVRQSPLNVQLNQVDSFWINNYDTHTYTRIKARMLFSTPHVYMYVQEGQSVSQTALQASANLFENQIYPTDRAIFGSEWSPGIDDDVHLTVLNTTGMGNIGGYFSSEDEYPLSVNPYSNQREMFYISLESTLPGSPDYNSTLAHEFQHMIHWYHHPVDLSWTNEGMSVLAQHINGFTADGLDLNFLQQPDTQLNDWSNNSSAALAHYGAGFLFMDYFTEHYGGNAILKELLQDPAAPPLNFDHVLAHHGYSDRFDDVLHKWYLANFIQDHSIDQGQFGYSTVNEQPLSPQHSFTTYPVSEHDTVHQYAAEYYDLPSSGRRGTLHITLNGSPTVRLIGNDPLGSTNEWWGNRYDNMDSTLTRSFDLTNLKGKSATLQFATWFDLERDYDYAFVEASTDGANWVTLKGNETTATNPNGANLGNGYTGSSGNGQTPQWVQEHIDLTPYAGKKVQIRFEEVTDDAVNLQGFAIDQISIPELNFQDTLTSDNGWVSHGFIRSNNVIPEHYTLQAIVYQGSSFTVQQVDADMATGLATLAIPNFGRLVTRVVLVISASAAETTLQARYQIGASVE